MYVWLFATPKTVMETKQFRLCLNVHFNMQTQNTDTWEQ